MEEDNVVFLQCPLALRRVFVVYVIATPGISSTDIPASLASPLSRSTPKVVAEPKTLLE